MLTLLIIAGLLVTFWTLSWAGLAWTDRGPALAEPVPPGGAHLPAIDGLRGILALSVVITHAHSTRSLYVVGRWVSDDSVFSQTGLYAVTLFFFITGFLFWSRLQRDPRPRLAKHFGSRARRLGPAYRASMLLLFGIVAYQSGWTLLEPVPLVVTEVVNWLGFMAWSPMPINGLANSEFINAGVAWTLRLEWLFYLMIPFCGWFAAKPWRAGLFLVVGTLGLRRLAMPAFSFEVIPAAVRAAAIQFSFFLMFVFSGGIAAAVVRTWIAGRLPAGLIRHPSVSALSLGGVVAVWLFGPADFGMVESGCLFVPFLLVALGNDWFGLLTTQTTLFLGKISYSIYLLHGFGLYLGMALINRFYPVATMSGSLYRPLVAGLGGVIILGSTVWHQWFEAPFMRAKRPAPAANLPLSPAQS